MRFEWLEEGDKSGLEAWDEFLLRSPRGHYCQLSTWLRSFRSYGFSFSVLVARGKTGGAIAGGIGLLRFGARPFGALSAPVGPIVEVGCEVAVRPILEAVLAEAKRRGAFLVQLQFPCAAGVVLPALLPSVDPPDQAPHYPGKWLPVGTAPGQMLWIEFPQAPEPEAWRELLLARFHPMTRRNIKLAQRQGLEVVEASSEPEIREAYTLIERNGRERGYATRRWQDFGPILLEQVARSQATVLLAQWRGRYVGAHYGVRAGRRYSYLMGAALREHGNLKIGHFLHWSAMNQARDLGLCGYDLTSGGTRGVLRFKMGFCPQRISFLPPESYVLSRWRCAVFSTVSPWLRRHKAVVSRVLSAGTRLLHGR